MPPHPSDALTDGFRAVMRRVASTVTVVTAVDPDRRHGMTVTAVSSLSMEPPALLVCINRNTLLHDVMTRGSGFCVNVLAGDQADVSTAFSGAVPPEERFGLGGWESDPDGRPYLTDGIANLFCRTRATLPYGTHTIFVGEVEGVRHGRKVLPLLYQDAHYCRCEPIDLVQV
ncbi:flavin reductase family protein [Nocardiopsis protaetiae]|uniref:flavin reductase family protein n=1 Tax=Nocardiopsis protaetiae TaxID=3382270 RepID=UPI00387B8DCE